MITSGYFSFGQGVPLMRCVAHFLCQFGIHSDPSKRKEFNDSLEDDVNWLPEGPNYRLNSEGVKRFARGYMAFAGGGKNSRSKQFIMALDGNGPLGGGSPWEVPWGEVVGDYSFDTMDKIYTGYGENGPPQGRLSKEGASAEVKENWPLLDYIQQCVLVDERVLDDKGNTVVVDE
jgi:cyclophilin family peptidyl-prolyl cis-trans isomerase